MKKYVAIFLTLLIANSGNAAIGDLFLPSDDVEILNVQNFKNHIQNSTTAWLVDFYASWCGDCQRFAPTWKKFATEVAAWRDMVRVAVLACSDEINTSICREYQIVHFPTVRYFGENYQSGKGVVVHHGERVDVQSVKKSVIEIVVNEIHEGRGTVYPNLLPYEASDLGRLFEGLPEHIQYVFLVVDPLDAHLGAEVALDIHKTPNISVKYSFNNNSELIAKLQIEKFPTIVALDRRNNSQLLTSDTNSKAVKTTIGTFLESKGLKIIEHIPEIKKIPSADLDLEHKERSKVVLRQHIKKMGDVIFQVDLEAALRYSLRQEVSTIEVIKGDQLQALNVYLTVLKKYFPFGHNSSSFVDELLKLTSESTEIKGVGIEEIVNRAENQGLFSSKQRFLGCQGSSTRYRGYPCSLWRLFHYLTVNSAQLNVYNKRNNPREVLEAMHAYVKYFFGCVRCSQHFQEMAAERNLTKVSSLDSSILWLWEAHNVVNARIKGDDTEDPEYPKYQFPTKFLCPECVQEDNSWKTDEVLKYLKRMYGRFNVRYIGADTRVLFPALD
jgi:thiol oxidase